MRILYLLVTVLSLQLCAASSAQLSSSQTFTDVDASEINRCVFQFAENRGKFDRYVCNLEMKIESTTSKTSAAKIHDLFIAEDRSKKLRRVDKITSDLGVEVNGELLESGDSYEMTVISRGDESRYFRGYGEEIDSDSVVASEKPFLKSDPWSICLLRYGRLSPVVAVSRTIGPDCLTTSSCSGVRLVQTSQEANGTMGLLRLGFKSILI